MKSTSSYHKHNLSDFGLILILTVWHGNAWADKPLLITLSNLHVNSWNSAIDINTPLAESFVFTSTQQRPVIQKTEIASVHTSYNYITDLTKWDNDYTQVTSSFQKPERATNQPLRMITDSVKQRNYLVVGSKVSTPLINGVYAYLAYHQEKQTPQDKSRQLSLGGRLEF